MEYKAEYDYLVRVLGKMHLQVICLPRDREPDRYLDLGLRKLLGVTDALHDVIRPPHGFAQSNTIYKLTDEFFCNYIFLLLPSSNEGMLVGPYLAYEKTREQLMEEAERYGVPAWRLHDLEACYADIPLIRDDSSLFAMMNVFGESIWGESGAFRIVDVKNDQTASPAGYESTGDDRDPAQVMLHMKRMESRYAYENELMQTVARGQSHRAERMISNFSRLTLEQRVPDPVRNMKNYCIVCNTLLRKAAESGGVHPMYLDGASSMIAKKVEGITKFEEGTLLMREMVRVYCRLVRKHTNQHFSQPVRQAITFMESDLTADLSLRALAELLNVNASYLSSFFHRETGKTLTEYATDLRMNYAAGLLETTTLQIQTVAQHCGMSDVNYFSKCFKRHYGATPREYRREHGE